MAELPRPKGFAGTAPKIAIGAAIAALATSLVAVIVVVTRDGCGGAASSTDGSGAAPGEARAAGERPPATRRVAAADVVKLRREAVTLVREAGKALGVKIADEELRKALDLGADDVITAIAGRPIEREYDVFDAVYGVKRLRATTIYVELLRDREPVLVRWQIDGDLQTARAPDLSGPYGSLAGASGLGILGGSGSGLGILGGGGLGSDPYSPLPPDPLADTIKRHDDTTFEVPRSTVEKVFASPSTYAGIARTLPSRRTSGFRVYGVRPSSIVAAAGIRNGDTIRAINGNPVGTADEVVELYPQIKDAKEWRIDLERRGKPLMITIAIK